MSLTVKHLNSDASFLLTFRSIPQVPRTTSHDTDTFTILIDPWLLGTFSVLHPSLSVARHRVDSCVSDLRDLPVPDLIIISQPKADHCHKETLMQLAPGLENTTILAEPSAAKIIRSWKYFTPRKVLALPKWQDSGDRRNPSTRRFSIAPLGPDGRSGLVTVSFIVQKNDLVGLHNAVGITYQAPTGTPAWDLTPPATPRSIPQSASGSFSSNLGRGRTLSVIHSPHGCNYKSLAPYVRAHLESENALPLTALLHCFDKISNPWWLGGNICSGFPGGLQVALMLRAKVWISAHDGDKEVKGILNKNLSYEYYDREKVESIISPRSVEFPRGYGTDAVVLGVGEEKVLSSCVLGDDCDSEIPWNAPDPASIEIVNERMAELSSVPKRKTLMKSKSMANLKLAASRSISNLRAAFEVPPLSTASPSDSNTVAGSFPHVNSLRTFEANSRSPSPAPSRPRPNISNQLSPQAPVTRSILRPAASRSELPSPTSVMSIDCDGPEKFFADYGPCITVDRLTNL